uniref:RdRp n=1 Tax=Erysiphe necator associated narnavirus 2 TaxID=2695335 RepID=A0A7S5I0D4_9VIRU|nr:RdRp [Erysiphe necator associated narnavirus 2]
MPVASASDSLKDAKHQIPGSLDPNSNLLGLSRSLDIHIPRPLVKVIGCFGRSETYSSRNRRVREELPYLPQSVSDKICKMNKYSLKRLSNTIEAINDNIMMSTPEAVRHLRGKPAYIKLMRWAYGLACFNSDKVCKQWKKFSVVLRWKALQSETASPEIPDDFPGFGDERSNLKELPPIWEELCPWLRGVWDRGVVSKAESTRLLHLVTSRNFPAGSKKTREQSLRKHAETLCSKPVVTDIRKKILRRLCVLFGRSVTKLKPQNFKSLGHLSLTSSASIDSTVKEGGRAAEVAVKFRTWATRIPDHDFQGETWFGRPYMLKAGTPVWQTMCRDAPVHRPTDEFGESAENMILDFENFKYEDPLYGLDSVTGFQLLQWSIEEGLANQGLEGTPYKSENRLRTGSIAPSIKASAIGEPGAKSRVVTVGEDWLTIFLQPFSHHLLGMAKLHPSVTAGLTRGWQLYEWVKRLRNAGPVTNQTTYFLSSDLTTATDFCTHEYSAEMVEGFMEGLGQDSQYLKASSSLLCSSRTYETDIEGFSDLLTSRGILMGDPGAKLVLTLHNICAEWEAFFRSQLGMLGSSDEEFYSHLRAHKGAPTVKWRHFACSGDDHIGQGPKKYLQRITLNHGLNGMSVSWSQNFLSSRGAFYCEEMLFTVGLDKSLIWGVETPLHKRPYLETPHIDAMKVRLFSPCSKECEGKDEPNPAIGKARQMQGMLSWLGGGFEAMVPMASARFEQRMEGFLPTLLSTRYLPVKLGGIGSPAFHRSKSELWKIFREETPWIQLQSIKEIFEGSASLLVRRCLANFATNARARGVSTDAIKDEVSAILSNAELVHGIDDSGLQLLTGSSDTDWEHLRFSDKVTIAKRYGLTTVDDAINNIDRPYLFRNMLAPQVSRRHGENPYKDKAYDVLPWKVRESRLLQNLEQARIDSQPPQGGDFESICEKLADWSVGNIKFLDTPQVVYFLPESVVVSEDLCTLRTPL